METNYALVGEWDNSCRQLGLIQMLVIKCLLHSVKSNLIEKNINL